MTWVIELLKLLKLIAQKQKLDEDTNKLELSFIINLLDCRFKDNIDIIKNELNENDFIDNELKYIFLKTMNNETPNDI